MKYSTTVLESQYDWLTVVAPVDGPGHPLVQLAYDAVANEVASDSKRRPFQLMGYSGQAAGRARWGFRDEKCLLQLSGDLAREHFDRAMQAGGKVTRLDLAVTVRVTPHSDNLAMEAYYGFCDAVASGRRLPQARLTQDSARGSTLYCGARESDTFLRLYNKAREDPLNARYADCWRYELEAKGDLSVRLAAADPGPTVRARFVSDYVHRAFATRSIEPQFTPTGDVVLASGLSRRSDARKRLDWLRSQVKPCIGWLRTQGYSADVDRILGDGDVG